MRTHWNCDFCNRGGKARHSKRASVYDVLHALEKSHALRSPDCDKRVAIAWVRITGIEPESPEGGRQRP